MAATLNKYNKVWTPIQVKHCLGRLGFGVDQKSLEKAIQLGFEGTINVLLNSNTAYDAPLNAYTEVDQDDETGVQHGKTWVNAEWNNGIAFKRKSSFRNWTIMRMKDEPSIREKMFLFWHQHFATELDMYRDARYAFQYYEIIRKNAFGNFRDFVKEISLCPAMLIYLNSVDNKKGAPDENYARELQELFTIGKEYEDRYTEEDVQQAAKVLTGYIVKRNNTEGWDMKPTFVPSRHDTTDKQFTSFYDNKVIQGRTGNSGEEELNELLEMILSKDQVSEHICRNLYRFFVHSEINEEIEQAIIKPLAAILRNGNYELKPVYETLFKSEHFFDPKFIGAMIKSPTEFVVATLRNFEAEEPDTVLEKYAVYTQVFNRASRMQQQVGDTPNVSGWPAYYQEPSYYKIWINSATLPERANYIKQLLLYNGFSKNSKRLRIDHVEFAKRIPNIENSKLLIAHLANLMFIIAPTQNALEDLTNVHLLDGTNDQNVWKNDWEKFQSNPDNNTNYRKVELKLKRLFNSLGQLPEYQLC